MTSPGWVASGQDGATTVAATMILAHMAGVRVFATGGIGGVHRGAETTMDISADLEELGRTPVAVVCAGAKSILDLGLTLEYLETKGVPVYGYQTLELPAFYTRTSGFQVDCRMDTPEEVAAALRASFALGMGNGSLIVNPIPETDSMDPTYINQVIQDAVDEANRQGIHGKAITPSCWAGSRTSPGARVWRATSPWYTTTPGWLPRSPQPYKRHGVFLPKRGRLGLSFWTAKRSLSDWLSCLIWQHPRLRSGCGGCEPKKCRIPPWRWLPQWGKPTRWP